MSPSTMTPLSSLKNQSIARRTVDFPAPFGPTKDVTSSTATVTSLRHRKFRTRTVLIRKLLAPRSPGGVATRNEHAARVHGKPGPNVLCRSEPGTPRRAASDRYLETAGGRQ